MINEIIEKRPPATEAEILEALHDLRALNKLWIGDLWRISNGTSICDKMEIYSTTEILERNISYDIPLNFPDQILIGDDSGGQLILIDNNTTQNFYLIGSGTPFLADAKVFNSFKHLISFVIHEDHEQSQNKGKILSTGVFPPSLNEILQIKKELHCDLPTSHFKKLLEKKNSILADNVFRAKYNDPLKKYGTFVYFSSTD